MYRKFKRIIYQILLPLIRLWKYLSWLYYLRTHSEILLNVGAGKSKFKRWFATDIDTLDVTEEKDFLKYFSEKKIHKILAEHVLEHLSNDDLVKMLKNFSKYTTDEVNIRIAVPDGFHPDKNYIERVKPGGIGDGAHDHRNLFDYKSLTKLFEKYGFKSKPVEYWDDKEEFHTNYSNDNNGFIERSFLNDSRNKDGKPHYTSLIIDFTKK